MQSKVNPTDLSRRERQVLDIVMRLQLATARDIQSELPRPPTYSAVRSILRILVNKGVLRKQRRGDRDWFSSGVPRSKAKRELVREFVGNLFAGSAVQAACALLGQKGVRLSKDEAGTLMRLIEEARKK
jgi:predicted transcriptional regulator